MNFRSTWTIMRLADETCLALADRVLVGFRRVGLEWGASCAGVAILDAYVGVVLNGGMAATIGSVIVSLAVIASTEYSGADPSRFRSMAIAVWFRIIALLSLVVTDLTAVVFEFLTGGIKRAALRLFSLGLVLLYIYLLFGKRAPRPPRRRRREPKQKASVVRSTA